MAFHAGATVIGNRTGAYDGFTDPGASAPRLGTIGGFTNNWNGAIHRCGLIQFDPETFDVAEWLTDEIAANGTRFA